MQEQIDAVLDEFEAGRLSRRQLVGRLAAFVAIAAPGRGDVAAAQAPPSTFEALGLNHLALRVTDLDRSQRFYEQHLGMTLIPSGDRSALRLMACGPHVLNLFKAAKAEMDHVCFTIADYDPKVAVDRLRRQDVTPDLQGDRTHFRDPDGYILQVGGPHSWGSTDDSEPRPLIRVGGVGPNRPRLSVILRLSGWRRHFTRRMRRSFDGTSALAPDSKPCYMPCSNARLPIARHLPPQPEPTAG